MIALFLTMASLELLRHMLLQGGEATLKAAQPGNNNNALRLDIAVERTEHRIRLRVSIADTTGELTLDPHEPGFFKQAQLFIEDLINGRIETAIPRPEPEQQPAVSDHLTTDDERTLRTVCRQGGSTTLSTGTVVNVHATEATLRTAVAAHQGRTHLCSGSSQDVYLSLAEHIQQLAAA